MRDENIPAFIGHLSFSFLAHGHRVPSLNWIITHLSHSIINWDDLDIFFLHTTNMRDCFSVCSSPHSSFNFHRLWAGGADIEAEYVFFVILNFYTAANDFTFFFPPPMSLVVMKLPFCWSPVCFCCKTICFPLWCGDSGGKTWLST